MLSLDVLTEQIRQIESKTVFEVTYYVKLQNFMTSYEEIPLFTNKVQIGVDHVNFQATPNL